jgi:hypothetical protein
LLTSFFLYSSPTRGRLGGGPIFSLTLYQFDSISFFISEKLILFSSNSILAMFVARLMDILSTQERPFREFSFTKTQLAQVIHSIINLFFMV